MNKRIINLLVVFILTLLVGARLGCAVSDESQYSIKDSGLVVDDASLIEIHPFYWLDNHRIITQTRGRIVDNPVLADYKKIGLVVFDTKYQPNKHSYSTSKSRFSKIMR